MKMRMTHLAVLAVHASFGDFPESSEGSGDIIRLGLDEFIYFQPSYLDRSGYSSDVPNAGVVDLRLVGCTEYWEIASCFFNDSTCEFELEGCSAHILVATILSIAQHRDVRLTLDFLKRLGMHGPHCVQYMSMLILQICPSRFIRSLQFNQYPTRQLPSLLLSRISG